MMIGSNKRQERGLSTLGPLTELPAPVYSAHGLLSSREERGILLYFLFGKIEIS